MINKCFEMMTTIWCSSQDFWGKVYLQWQGIQGYSLPDMANENT